MKILCSMRTLLLIAAWAGAIGVVVGALLTHLATGSFP